MREKFYTLRDLGIVTAVISAVFLSFYWGCLRDHLPLAYEGDAIGMLMRIEGYASGETSMWTPQILHRLNAPFQGSWSDYPTEKMIYWSAGMFARFFGLETGTTLYILFLQILAGVIFYGCGRLMGLRRDYLVAGGILFGLAPYAFLRNLNHMILTAYWHLPMIVVTLLWLWDEAKIRLPKTTVIWFACLTGFIAGNLNPYYLGIFLILLALVSLGFPFRKEWEKCLVVGGVILSSIAGFFIQNVDKLLLTLKEGGNHEAVSRNLWWLTKFGLYLPDLVFPRAHQSPLINKISWALYQSRVPGQLWGESQTAYIGIISAIGLAALILSGVVFISLKKVEKIPPLFWLSSATILFALAGGVNYLLGSFGFLLLRSTNRVSILLSCMALYFLCENVPRFPVARWKWLVPACLVIIGIWDQVPKYPVWEEAIRQRAWKDYAMDREFFKKVEKELPTGGMVFELPVKEYPEMGTIREMGDYEHFRPVLHTTGLRFSYGTVKGRGGIEWQKIVAAKPAPEMLGDLERYGFNAILINRKAYEDGGELFKKNLSNAGAIPLFENRDFLVLIIHPSSNLVLPEKKAKGGV